MIKYDRGNHNQALIEFFALYIGTMAVDKNTKKAFHLRGVRDDEIQIALSARGSLASSTLPNGFLILLQDVYSIKEADVANCTQILGLDKKFEVYIKRFIQQYSDENDFFESLSGHRIKFSSVIEMLDYLRSNRYYLPYKGINFGSIVINSLKDCVTEEVCIDNVRPEGDWIYISGFNERYMITKDSVIWDNKRKKEVHSFVMPNTKILFVTLQKNGNFIDYPLKRLVMMTFSADSRTDKMNLIGHLDGDYRNVTHSNLTWYADKDETRLVGQKNNHKLTETDVNNIRDRHTFEDVTVEQISAEFDISVNLIKRIVSRQYWNKI